MKTSPEARQKILQLQRRKMGVRLNTGVALLLAALLVGMLNYLSYRHYARVDLNRNHYYSLSDKTRKLITSLPSDIKVIVFFQREQEIFSDVHNILREYEYLSARIKVEYVDPDRDPARTEELAARYNVKEPNVVVFDSGLQSKFVTADEIYSYDYDGLKQGSRSVPIAFKGEQAFSSAIHGITQEKAPVVYFLAGHGEKDVQDFDRRTGYSSVAILVERDNVEVKTLRFGEAQEIPADCAALVVAGPSEKLSAPELELISTYLNRNGRAMFLLDALTETGLEHVLSKWGITLARDIVIDNKRTLTGRELFVASYGNHPITRQLEGISSIFYLPRSIRVPSEEPELADAPAADRPRVTALASCSQYGWAEMNIDKSPAKYDPGVDLPGPVPVAAAVERGPVPGVDVTIRPTRLVVFGDSEFVSNSAMAGGDVDLFLNALNWLLERPELISVAPREIEQVMLAIDKATLQNLFLVVVAGLPGAVILLGGIVWLVRRV